MPTHDSTQVDSRVKVLASEVAHRAATDTLAAVEGHAAKLATDLDVDPRVATSALLLLAVDQIGLELRAAGRATIDSYVESRTEDGVSVRTAISELGDVMKMSRSGVGCAFGRRTDPPVTALESSIASPH